MNYQKAQKALLGKGKRFLSGLLSALLVIGQFGWIPSTFAADSFTISITENSNQTKVNPGAHIVYNVFLKNNFSSSTGALNPGIGVSFDSNAFTYNSSTWTTNQIPAGGGGVGFNPPTSNTGTFDVGVLQRSKTAEILSLDITTSQSLTATGITLSAVGFADNFPSIAATPLAIAVNSAPHIKSLSFGKSSIINNGIDSTSLTVRVLDYNGCSDLSGGSSSMTVDLSALGGGSAVSPSSTSCDSDGLTNIYTFNGITTTGSTGSKTVTATARDAEGHVANSDSNFTSDDGSTSTSISVNGPTAPVISSTSATPSPVKAGQSVSVSWQSSQTGSYVLYGGAGASCGSGTTLASGTVATANSTVSTNVSSDNLPEGVSQIVICVTNTEPTTGSAPVSITKDSIAPVPTIQSYTNNITSQDVTLTFQSDETGTYHVYVNNVDTGVTGSVSAVSTNVVATVPNATFTVNPGNNDLKVTVTDTAGNIGTSSTVQVNKDFTQPSPASNVQLTDCDYIGNSGTPCASMGNPRSGMSGRDFYVSWDPPTGSGGFVGYYIYVLPTGTTLDTSIHSPVKTLGIFSQTGILLDDAQSFDSSGATFPQTGTGQYTATVLVKKNNGLYSTNASSSGVTITADTITYPQLQSAAFTSNTGITLTYNKTLTGALSAYNATRLSSASNCFRVDTSSGTGAKSVSGNTVTFAVQSLNDEAKTCSDLAVTGTGLVTDYQSLYSEETLTGVTVSDGQIPLPITITSPSTNAFIGGAGTFTFAYTLPEAMSGSALKATFTDASGSTAQVSLSSATSSGAHSMTLTGSSIGLVDGKAYSIVITGKDLSGNSGVSNTVSNVVYDITPPSVPVLSTPLDGVFTNVTAPPLVWLASTDNYSSSSNLRYAVQVSLASDFSTTVSYPTNLSGTGYTVSPNLTTNGQYYWRVMATDESGNASTFCASRTFTFDNTPPSFSGSSTYTYVQNVSRSFTGYVRNGDTVEVRTVVTDNFESQMAAANVVANLSSLGGGSAVTASSYSTSSGGAIWSLTANCSSDGTKTIQITATDKAGNTATQNVNVVCDNTAPAIVSGTVTAPANGAYLSGGISYNITWNASFYSTDLSQVSNPIDIDYSSNGGSTWSNLATGIANSGTFAWNVPSVNISNAQIRVTANDKLGNTANVVKTFTIDSTNPSVASNAILSPNGGEYLKGSTGTGILITWNTGNVTDTNIGATPISLAYSTNGSTWTGIVSNIANSGSYTWTSVPALNSSTVKIKLTATDLAGNVSSDTSDASFTIDSTLPNITVNVPPTPPNNAYLSNNGFDIQAAGSDTNLYKISYSLDDGNSLYWNQSSSSWFGVAQWNDICTNAAACALASATPTPSITDGHTYHLLLRVTDLAGNTKDSSTYTYVGDTVAPNLATTLASNAYFSGAVSIAGTSSDSRSGISSVKVSILRESDSTYWTGTGGFSGTSAINLATNTSNSYANWSYTGFTVPAGDADGTSYLVTYSATDNAYKFNNTSTGSVRIYKDATGPSIAGGVWTSPSAATFWNGGGTQTLRWNTGSITDANSGVNQTGGIALEYYRASGTGWVTIASGISNSGSYVWTVPAIDDDVNFRIRATDNAGNQGAGVTSATVTVDSLPPTVSSVSTMDQAASGKIDGLLVTMSEPIICSTVRTSDFTIAGIGTPTSVSSCSGNSSSFILNFSPFGTTASKPTLSYAGAGTLTDRAGNHLAIVTNFASTDGAVPRILSATILDNNANGKVDRISVTFSETLAATTNASAWTIVSPLAGVWTAPTSVSVSGNTATLTISEPTAYDTSTGGMSLAFTANSNWKDVANNVAASNGSVTLADGAAPQIIQATTADVNGTYRAQIVFSEAMTGILQGFSLGGTSTFTGGIVTVNPTTYQLVTTDSTATDTSKTFTLAYSATGWVTDPSGNALVAIASKSVTDAIAPKILSRTTVDSSHNGKIDAVRIAYSETLGSNISGYSVAVAGYTAGSSSVSGSAVTTSLTEGSAIDTSATPQIQVTNTSLADSAGNLFPSEWSSTAASDGVGPVVTQARYDGTDKVFVTFSEAYTGSLNNSSFTFSGSSITINSVSMTSSTTATITMTGSVVYGTTEVSAAANAVSDALANAQSATYFTKVSASVIINEVMWSGTGSKASQYIELRNLGTSPVDLTNWTIDNAASNGTSTLTIPSGTIGAGGLFLITATATSNASNLVANGITPDAVLSLSLDVNQAGNLVLKSASGTVFDNVKANPWPAGNDASAYSMERKASPGDGLTASNWYTAMTGSGFFDTTGPLGTPGSTNVFDITAPTINSTSIADSQILPVGNYTLTYGYTDDIAMANSPAFSFLLQKNDGVGNYSSYTASGVTSSGANASAATFTLQNLPAGAYRATFTVPDAAGNQAQKITNFYVDNAQMTVSATSVNIGSMSANTLIRSGTKVTITVKTVGAPFDLTLGGSGTLAYGFNNISSWDAMTGSGFGYSCAPSWNASSTHCDSTIRAIAGNQLENVSSPSPDSNGNLKTFVYDVEYDTKFDETQVAATYLSTSSYGLSLTY